LKTHSTSIRDALASIDISQLKPDIKTQTENGSNSLTIGLTKPDKVQLKYHGSGHGGTGFAVHSKGGEVQHQIQMDQQGFAAEPQLTGQDWLLIDEEIRNESNNFYDKIVPSEKFEDGYLPVLIQGKAALRASPFEQTLTRLTRLKLRKPTQTMNESEISVFLEDTCEMLEKRGYCYRAIDEGITQLLEREDEKFFPTDKVLLKYIHPIHWKLKQRVDKLDEMLMRRHNLIEQSKATAE
tara:strand:- start:868 stop:1584 length:717 start_codon:yes stop_codon:yes gene_type:complete